MQADEAGGGFQAREPVQGSGDADRAPGIGAQRGWRQPSSDSHAGAAGGAARNAMRFQVPRVPGRPEARIGAPAAEREFDHVGLAEDDHAGREKPFDDGRRRHTSPPYPGSRAPGRDEALDIEQVLQRNRQPMKRRQRKAGLPLAIRRFGHGHGLLLVNGDVRVQLAVQFGDTRKIEPGQLG